MNKKSYLQSVMEMAELNPYAYSGRGMFGRYCVGVNVDSLGSFLRGITTAAFEFSVEDENFDYDDFADELGNIRQDSMGTGVVLYFPDVDFVKDEDEDEDEDSENESEDHTEDNLEPEPVLTVGGKGSEPFPPMSEGLRRQVPRTWVGKSR